MLNGTELAQTKMQNGVECKYVFCLLVLKEVSNPARRNTRKMSLMMVEIFSNYIPSTSDMICVSKKPWVDHTVAVKFKQSEKLLSFQAMHISQLTWNREIKISFLSHFREQNFQM